MKLRLEPGTDSAASRAWNTPTLGQARQAWICYRISTLNNINMRLLDAFLTNPNRRSSAMLTSHARQLPLACGRLRLTRRGNPLRKRSQARRHCPTLEILDRRDACSTLVPGAGAVPFHETLPGGVLSVAIDNRPAAHSTTLASHDRAVLAAIPQAAISETSSNSWKLSVISVFSCSACTVGRPSMVSWMVA